MLGAGVVTRSGGTGSSESHWIAFVMLVFTTVCMITHRGQWPISWRVGFVPAASILHALISVPMVVVVLFVRPELQDRAVSFLSSLPVVLFAMRHSRLFVIPEAEPAEAQDTPHDSANMSPKQ